MPIMKRRLGLPFSMLWTAVGAIIGFNVIFNHFMATVVKANGPAEQVTIEKLRMYYKQRLGRKEFSEENDRFEGISPEVKQVLKYRTKGIEDVRQIWGKFC